MPEFKNREEYEKWKARKLKELQEKKQAPEVPPPSTEGPQKEEKKVSPGEAPSQAAAQEKCGPLTDVGDLFRNSWEVYKRRIGPLIALYLFSFFCFIAAIAVFAGIGFLFSLPFEGSKGAFIAAGAVIGTLAGMIILFWGLAAVVFAVVDEGLGIRESLARGWHRIWAFMWFFSIAGFIITGGFLLFFFPGLIFLVWFAFGQFILASEDERGMNALLKSREYVKGYWFDVFLRLFLVWLASLAVGIIPFIGPIFSLLFMPFVMIFTFLLYEDLKSRKGAVTYTSTAGEKLKWLGAGTLGYLLIPLLLLAFLGASLTIPFLLLKGMLSSTGREMILSPDKWPQVPGMVPQTPGGQELYTLPQQGQAVAPGQGEPGSFPQMEDKKPDAAGEATLLLDGISETYILKTGFFSDTRFKDPTHATIQFQAPGAEHSNARRIELTLDATRAGRHFADGKAINDSMFGRSSLSIGENTPSGIAASFKFVADGGQIFPPKDSCVITITSPYTGTPGSVFVGEVSGCLVHSAGIDRTLSSIRFSMRGVPSH